MSPARSAPPDARVLELWRHPVKSMRGERCDALALEPRGVVGDRVRAVRTAEGKLGSGKSTRRFERVEGLLALRSRLGARGPEVSFPDGRRLEADAPAIHDALSEALGRRVTLVREAAVSHLDAAPVHLITTASLRWLGHALPGSTLDAERFRPNLVVDLPGEAPVERAWSGWILRVGADVRLRVVAEAERCRMVGLAQGPLPEDRAILEHLAREASARFGVYAEVLRPGVVRGGDRIAFDPPGEVPAC